MERISSVPEYYPNAERKSSLTARAASSGVEKATNPEPLLAPLGSRIICTIDIYQGNILEKSSMIDKNKA